MVKITQNIQKDIDNDDKIAEFFRKEMDAKEESDFLDTLNSDKTLHANADIQARLIKGMNQTDSELLDAFRQSSLSDIKSIIKPKKTLSFYYKWVSVAACIGLVIFGTVRWFDYYDTTNLGIKYANEFPYESVILRGESNNGIENELTILFDNVINNKDLPGTNKKLQELWEIANSATYNDYTEFAPYIGWYLAIGYLEDYKKKEAKEVLKSIKSLDPKIYLNEQVDFLLKELK